MCSQKRYKNISAETVSMDLKSAFKKDAFKKVSKKLWPRWGLNPGWLTVEVHRHRICYVCGCSSTFSGSFLYQCLQHAVKNEQNHISICRNAKLPDEGCVIPH